jgi:hypothetical protein
MNKPGFLSLSSVFGMVMIIAVLALAAGVAFTDMLSDRLYGSKRTFFIVLMLAYAAYRGFRIYQVSRAGRRESQ